MLSAIVAHTAWHWMVERWDRLRQYHVEWPAVTPELLLVLVRWTMAAVALAAALWLVSVLRAQRAKGKGQSAFPN